MIENLQQYFLNPLGLLGLLALIPLIVFYLVKPKPEEEVMPSMAFFSEDQKKGRIKSALQTLKRNRLLLLHILFISLAAAAIANPLVPGLESDGRAVIILDDSASMQDNRQEVENFALEHLGETNTVITASQNPQIEVREGSTEKARSYIRQHENSESGTDLVSALQLASNFEGKLVLASDMDHTATNQELEPILDDLASDRKVNVMVVDHENSHGFTDLNFKDGKVEVKVQNFRDRNRTLELEKPGENQRVKVGPLSTETFSLSLEPGKHELSLPPDEFAIDNKLHISRPENQQIKVKRLGEESRYFREAINLINSTEYSSGEDIGDADVYFVSQGFELTDRREESLMNEVEEGKAVILERKEAGDIAPVKNRSGRFDSRVEVSAGITSSFNSSIFDYDITGQPLATPEEALVLSEDERVLLYNVEDENFGEKIAYPIFWKNTIQRVTDLKTGGQLHIETGVGKTFEDSVWHKGQKVQGYTVIDSTGFYEGEPTYAANLLKPKESSPHVNRVTSRTDIGEDSGSDPAQKYIVALLALIGALEITYLSSRGDLR